LKKGKTPKRKKEEEEEVGRKQRSQKERLKEGEEQRLKEEEEQRLLGQLERFIPEEREERRERVQKIQENACRAVPPRPCLGSIAIHDTRCRAVTPFIKDCLTEAILIPLVHYAAAVPLDTNRNDNIIPLEGSHDLHGASRNTAVN
jgi:hypothetical protein